MELRERAPIRRLMAGKKSAFCFKNDALDAITRLLLAGNSLADTADQNPPRSCMVEDEPCGLISFLLYAVAQSF